MERLISELMRLYLLPDSPAAQALAQRAPDGPCDPVGLASGDGLTRAIALPFRKAAGECERYLEAKLPIPAYEQAIKASHVFNTLQARGVISVAERQAYIGRVRDLAKAACGAWLERAA